MTDSHARECINETISVRVKDVYVPEGMSCVLKGAIVTTGNVQASGAKSLKIRGSFIENGDIIVEGVQERVQIIRNALPNGDIHVSKSQNVKVDRNYLESGDIRINKNYGDKGKSTKVSRNHVDGGNIYIEKNEEAKVTKNNAYGMIQCSGNGHLHLRDNNAGDGIDCHY